MEIFRFFLQPRKKEQLLQVVYANRFKVFWDILFWFRRAEMEKWYLIFSTNNKICYANYLSWIITGQAPAYLFVRA